MYEKMKPYSKAWWMWNAIALAIGTGTAVVIWLTVCGLMVIAHALGAY